MAAITICSDFGAQKDKVWHYFHCFPIYQNRSIVCEIQTPNAGFVEGCAVKGLVLSADCHGHIMWLETNHFNFLASVCISTKNEGKLIIKITQDFLIANIYDYKLKFSGNTWSHNNCGLFLFLVQMIQNCFMSLVQYTQAYYVWLSLYIIPRCYV